MSDVHFKLPDRPTMKTWKGAALKYIHVKIDGHFTYLVKSNTGVSAAFTRQGTEITKQLHGRPFWHNFVRYAEDGAIIMGEIYHPQKHASYVKTALASELPIYFAGFALGHKPADWTLQSVALEFAQMRVPFANYIPNNGKTLPKFDGRLEGYVYKDGNMLNWQRHKPKKTIDCIVTGLIRGDKAFMLTLGSAEVSVYHDDKLVEIARVSGFTEKERDYFWKNKDHLIGKVVEVEYQHVDSKGRLRHPTFIRIRDEDDKSAKDCTTLQDSDLLTYRIKNA